MEIVICPCCGEKLQRGKYRYDPERRYKKGLGLAGDHDCFIESQKEITRKEKRLIWSVNGK